MASSEGISADLGTYSVAGADAQLVVTKYHQKLLESADNLFNQGQYSFAIVLAHTACELAVEQVFNKLFEDRKLTDFQEFIMPRRLSYNISAKDIK